MRSNGPSRRFFGLFAAIAVAVLAFPAPLTVPANAQFFFGDRNPFFFERRPPPRQQRQQQQMSPFEQFFGGFRSQPQPSPHYGPNGGYYHEQQPRQAPAPVVDSSRAPPPRKTDTPPTMSIVVMGDSMADWLAYGLEDAFSDAPEVGVVRKHRTDSGLIRYDARSDTDWARAARDILAAEKPDFVVMMVGLHDRQPIRERAAPQGQPGQQQQPGQGQPAGQAGQPAKPEGDPEGGENAPTPPATERGRAAAARGATATTYEFRSERWAELYAKKIDDTIAALKSKGVPVIWVGLPALRGTRSTSEMSYLNTLYRAQAEKAGVAYVDVWDGFVDESGRFTTQGPDFEGQIRRLRTADGVHFTKAGARKLAHYVERELRRTTSRALPVALPTEPSQEELQPGQGARPEGPAPRPVAGPVVPLTAAAVGPEELLGRGADRSSGGDPLVSNVLVKGEPIAAPSGRADDFAWPRRGTAASTAEETLMPVPVTASVPPPVAVAPRPAAAPAAHTPVRRRPQASGAEHAQGGEARQHRPRPHQQQQQQQRAVPRPPAPVGPFGAFNPTFTPPWQWR